MIVTGTDNVFVWWFLITLPLAFVLLSARVFQNLFEDIRKYRTGETMIEQTVLGGQ
jgi:TRAP-type C4-dicarboxylate transport system permease small subunit